MIITKPQKNIRKDKTMKEKYEKAELEVIEFETEDVITTSSEEAIPLPEIPF